MNIDSIQNKIKDHRNKLLEHKLYSNIESIKDLQVFTENHIYAVWDFMSLLKALQIELTTTEVPWTPAKNPTLSRFINEIVHGEESDVNELGEAKSHFEMYLEAMDQAGASTKYIHSFIQKVKEKKSVASVLNDLQLRAEVSDFVNFTFTVIETRKTHLIASAFTFGREDLIPDMFIEIIKNLKNPEGVDLSDLIYYFERHIEVDSGEHGPMALEMIQQLCGTDTEKWESALRYSKQALEFRIELWDGILATSKNKTPIFSIQ